MDRTDFGFWVSCKSPCFSCHTSILNSCDCSWEKKWWIFIEFQIHLPVVYQAYTIGILQAKRWRLLTRWSSILTHMHPMNSCIVAKEVGGNNCIVPLGILFPFLLCFLSSIRIQECLSEWRWLSKWFFWMLQWTIGPRKKGNHIP